MALYIWNNPNDVLDVEQPISARLHSAMMKKCHFSFVKESCKTVADPRN